MTLYVERCLQCQATFRHSADPLHISFKLKAVELYLSNLLQFVSHSFSYHLSEWFSTCHVKQRANFDLQLTPLAHLRSLSFNSNFRDISLNVTRCLWGEDLLLLLLLFRTL